MDGYIKTWIFVMITHTSLGLQCQKCVNVEMEDKVGTGATFLTVVDGFNTYKDAGCGQWGSRDWPAETCDSDSVLFGKALTSGTEGVTFEYKCAAITMEMDLTFSFSFNEGQSSTLLRMTGAMRSCIAVPTNDPYTSNACYDLTTNRYLNDYEGDLSIPMLQDKEYVVNEGMNIGCICSTDSCNSNVPSSMDGVVIGPATTRKPTPAQTTRTPAPTTTTPAPTTTTPAPTTTTPAPTTTTPAPTTTTPAPTTTTPVLSTAKKSTENEKSDSMSTEDADNEFSDSLEGTGDSNEDSSSESTSSDEIELTSSGLVEVTTTHSSASLGNVVADTDGSKVNGAGRLGISLWWFLIVTILRIYYF